MRQYIVDAFTEEVFAGNPAAVCFPDRWPEDALMRRIAMENNLSETAFVVQEADGLHIRWFTPGGEIDLCGHATLASAYVYFQFVDPAAEQVTFQSLSGPLTVTREGSLLAMDFPAYALAPTEVTEAMAAVLGRRPREAWLGRDLLCILDRAEDVTALRPEASEVVLSDGSDLGKSTVFGSSPNWIGVEGLTEPLEVTVRLRHSRTQGEGVLYPEGEGVRIEMNTPARAPTPGQLAVFYLGDVVAGSAWIVSSQ